jgi:uridylate kinase
LVKGTHSGVDGVYDSDPRTNPDAKKYETVRYSEVISKELRVMDATAVTFCKENGIPIVVFDMSAPGALRRILTGDQVGTIIQ